MGVYRKILVPVDGSPTAMRGLREAMRIAADQEAKLILLHVVDELLAVSTPEAGAYVDQLIGSLREAGRKILAKAEKQAQGKGLQVATLMPEMIGGRAADEIVRQAKKLRADLIVLGTHGRRGIQRLALGSDAEQVIRNTTVPVLIVRG